LGVLFLPPMMRFAAAGTGAQKNPVILVRGETTPEDIHGMEVVAGILTSRGGMTSHAAVVTRGMGKCCVVGAGEIEIDDKKKIMRVGPPYAQRRRLAFFGWHHGPR